MLIFDEQPLRIYALPLSRGGLNAARTAILSLIDEAFPDETPVLNHTPEGAPLLTGIADKTAISISHSSSQAVLAVRRGSLPVGIDTETVDRDHQLARVTHKYLTSGQYEIWGRSPSTRLVAWCIKEAVYKYALSPGLPLASIPLPEVGFIQSGSGSITLNDRDITVRLITEWNYCGPIVAAW